MSKSLTLWEMEDQLTALLETADLVPDEMKPAFIQELGLTEAANIAKRDRVARFLLFLRNAANNATEEAKRQNRIAASIGAALDWLERQVVLTIKSTGPDEDGKYRRLEGKTHQMFVKALPVSVDPYDPEKIPPRFKQVCVRMSLETWNILRAKHPELDPEPDEKSGEVIIPLAKPGKVEIPLTPIREAIERGYEVPGARLREAGHDHSLVVR